MTKLNPTSPRPMSRRQMLKLAALGGAGFAASWLAGCGSTAQAPAATAQVAPTAAGAAATTGGGGAAGTAGTFKSMSWESEEEIRKWKLHIDNFFKQQYPQMNVQLDWGVEW